MSGMRAALLLTTLAACSFEVASSQPGPMIDARPPDAPRNTVCHVATGTPATGAGTVGLSGGGGSTGQLQCDAGEVIVGIAVDTSNGAANGQSRSARGIRIYCASVSIDGSGPHETTPTPHEIEGNGGAGWSPSTWSLPAMCVPGGVVTMLGTHGGLTSNVTNLFFDTSITCSQLDVQGTVIASAVLAIIDGTSLTGMNASTAACRAGAQIVTLGTDVGAGLDSVAVSCAPTICQ